MPLATVHFSGDFNVRVNIRENQDTHVTSSSCGLVLYLARSVMGVASTRPP